MKSFNKIDNKLLIINVLFIFFPLSFILGNLFINLNVVLISIFTYIFFPQKIWQFKFNLFDKIITLFFIYTFLVLLINFFEARFVNQNFSSIIINKTILFLRYYLLYIILRFLVSQNLLKINWFFISCTFFTIFVCVDIYFQFIFGKDIFGIQPVTSMRLSGPFGDELIAGGYIQRFYIFSLFALFILNQKKNINRVSIQVLLFLIFIIGIILSGNRMPFVLFVFSFFLFFIFEEKIRKYFFLILLFFCLTVGTLYQNNKDFKYNVSNFYYNTKWLVDIFITKKTPLVEGTRYGGKTNRRYYVESKTLDNWERPYVVEFYHFNKTWKKNPILGGGLRSFRVNCYNCNSHPHNYYFEILNDLGLLGFIIMAVLLFGILYKLFIKINIFNLKDNSSKNILPFFIIFLCEFFPIRTSGSFFSTNNATFIFIILALLISLMEKEEKKLI